MNNASMHHTWKYIPTITCKLTHTVPCCCSTGKPCTGAWGHTLCSKSRACSLTTPEALLESHTRTSPFGPWRKPTIQWPTGPVSRNTNCAQRLPAPAKQPPSSIFSTAEETCFSSFCKWNKHQKHRRKDLNYYISMSSCDEQEHVKDNLTTIIHMDFFHSSQ